MHKGKGRIQEKSVLQKTVTAFLVGIYFDPSDKKICEEHLEELSELSRTCGFEVVGAKPCPLKRVSSATYLGKGKIKELISDVESTEADLIIFDEEISPNQERNLEKLFNRVILDRTGLILEVFAKRAQTREAKIQIELAKSKYELPRLKRLWTHLSRQSASGGGMYLRGAGERQIEIDRRLVKKRITSLQKELTEVRMRRQLQRQARLRSKIFTIALIGYTNAGKSTLLNALTHSEVFAEDKLFATLDTTTRKATLPNHQEVLYIDTVGFIRKLPHALVAAFKSTLEEVLYTDLLIHLIDVSHPMAIEQAETTYEVLKELKALHRPIITVLNKIDKITDRGKIQRFRVKYPKTVGVSALKGEGIEELLKLIIKEIQNLCYTCTLRISQREYGILSRLMQEGEILEQYYEDNDIIVKITLPKRMQDQVSAYTIQ
ncbi:MAG: GTPase HflX [Chlamydiales bacterium]